jgi:tetratricopeptide (TPR) repeat protein
VRRVELTHDVLCAVVKASRDLRHEREARDRTERLLSEQRDRELAARQALKRARRIAAGCAALALLAVIALAFAFVSLGRAHRAELAAQESRAAAETARSHAEHLLGYLNEDFAVELAGFGTLGLIKQLGERETRYYDSLPSSLQTTDTVRSAALAQVHFGIAQQESFDLKGARSNLTNAVTTLEHLREQGDTSEESAIALATGLAALADVDDRVGDSEKQTQEYNDRAEALLRSYVDAPNPSVAIRRAYGEVALSVGSYRGGEGALALLARAKQAFESIGALKLTDLPASADYALTLSFEAAELWRQGRIDEVKKVSEQGMQLANDVLAQRPGHIVALRARSALNLLGSSPAHEDLRIGDSAEFVKRALEDGLLLLRLDPANVDTRSLTAYDAAALASDYEQLGRPRDARVALQQSIKILLASGQGAVRHGDYLLSRYASIARIDADLGERDAGETTVKEAEPMLAEIQAAVGKDSYISPFANCSFAIARARLAVLDGDFKQAVAVAQPALESSLTWKARYGHAGSVVFCPSNTALIIGNAELMLGNYAAAKSALASAVPIAATGDDWVSRNYHASLIVLQSIAMSRLGQTTEARALLTPVLDWQRARFARNHDDAEQRLDYASALYALALTDGAHRGELLNQAAAIIAALPAEMRALKSTRMWLDRVQSERGHAAAS